MSRPLTDLSTTGSNLFKSHDTYEAGRVAQSGKHWPCKHEALRQSSRTPIQNLKCASMHPVLGMWAKLADQVKERPCSKQSKVESN